MRPFCAQVPLGLRQGVCYKHLLIQSAPGQLLLVSGDIYDFKPPARQGSY